MNLNKNYWDNRYISNTTGWDAGSVTTPIKEYFDQFADKNIKILIPGCGFGHEAKYLWQQGFHNLYVADISDLPLNQLKNSCPDIPDNQLLQTDFFEISEGEFDVIIEQTFFCALDPSLRTNYAQKMHQLLKKGGKLVGLLFSEEFDAEGPPFGGTKDEYVSYFTSFFDIKYMDPCYNSIAPRAGKELFILLINK